MLDWINVFKVNRKIKSRLWPWIKIILSIITMYWALKVEKLKKKNDIQTYKEIVAFTEGKKLDELHKAVEVGKRPYQNILKVIISAGVTAMICFLIGVLMHVFLN